MHRKIYITKYKHFQMTAVYEDEQLTDIYADRPEDAGILDRIYIGKVKNIVKNIQAAFVDIGGIEGYYSLEENKCHLYMNGKDTHAALVPGDELLVQVIRENVKTKAPVLTANIALAGKYMVLKGQKTTIGISSKITDDKERIRLKNIFASWLDDDCGFIVRTKASEVNENILYEEMQQLKDKYHSILEKGRYLKCYSEVYKETDEYLRRIMKMEDAQLVKVSTDIPQVYEQLKAHINPDLVVFYDDATMSLKNLLSLETKIKRLLIPQVWLKNGGSIVITPTEAMVVIDVNTGRYTGKKKQEETYFKMNMEAAKEIFRQLRLRNLSGIIIIDFIDMKSAENKQQLMDYLKKLAALDPVKTVVVDMTELNLVEITRKKGKKPLHEQMGQLCRTCMGQGYVIHA